MLVSHGALLIYAYIVQAHWRRQHDEWVAGHKSNDRYTRCPFRHAEILHSLETLGLWFHSQFVVVDDAAAAPPASVVVASASTVLPLASQP